MVSLPWNFLPELYCWETWCYFRAGQAVQLSSSAGLTDFSFCLNYLEIDNHKDKILLMSQSWPNVDKAIGDMCFSKTTTKFNFCLFADRQKFQTLYNWGVSEKPAWQTLDWWERPAAGTLTLNWPCAFCSFNNGIEECPIDFNII